MIPGTPEEVANVLKARGVDTRPKLEAFLDYCKIRCLTLQYTLWYDQAAEVKRRLNLIADAGRFYE